MKTFLRWLRCFVGLHDWATAEMFGDRVKICSRCMASSVERLPLTRERPWRLPDPPPPPRVG